MATSLTRRQFLKATAAAAGSAAVLGTMQSLLSTRSVYAAEGVLQTASHEEIIPGV